LGVHYNLGLGTTREEKNRDRNLRGEGGRKTESCSKGRLIEGEISGRDHHGGIRGSLGGDVGQAGGAEMGLAQHVEWVG